MTPAGILRLDGVTKQYAKVALSETSLAIDRGSFVSVVGPSGCGKSTLLMMLAGLLPPSSGTRSFEGVPFDSPPFEVIYIFQQYNKSIFPWKTVHDNIVFGLSNRTNMTRSEMDASSAEVIETVGLGGFESYYPWELSGGMQQRVAIARALVCEPAVLLMDEPFSALDAFTRNELQDLLIALWERLDITVIFVTHDVDEAVYLAEKVVVMASAPGRVLDQVDIALDYPRDQVATRETKPYLDARQRIMGLLAKNTSTTEASDMTHG
ncbi:MAG: ATP-binding cassette domain-containing protein [Acidimicrobiia bacterium]|nr:ATP-binding cassette domain-containing protein [Acidimicrobiia bacterium]